MGRGAVRGRNGLRLELFQPRALFEQLRPSGNGKIQISEDLLHFDTVSIAERALQQRPGRLEAP